MGKYLRNQALIYWVIKRIKRIREERGVTLEDFYADTNIHLARIETGRVNLTLSTLDAICKYFNLTLKEFFSEDLDQ